MGDGDGLDIFSGFEKHIVGHFCEAIPHSASVVDMLQDYADVDVAILMSVAARSAAEQHQPDEVIAINPLPGSMFAISASPMVRSMCCSLCRC